VSSAAKIKERSGYFKNSQKAPASILTQHSSVTRAPLKIQICQAEKPKEHLAIPKPFENASNYPKMEYPPLISEFNKFISKAGTEGQLRIKRNF